MFCVSLKKQVSSVASERWSSLNKGTYFPRKRRRLVLESSSGELITLLSSLRGMFC